MENTSARNMWGDYLDKHLEHAFVDAPKVLKLYDNPLDGDKAAELVKNGSKKAITYSLLGLQGKNAPLPKRGEFKVITNWEDIAQCIVKVNRVELKPLFSIQSDYVHMDGDGSPSVEAWKKWYWNYFSRELEPLGKVPKESMILVCVLFEKVYG